MFIVADLVSLSIILKRKNRKVDIKTKRKIVCLSSASKLLFHGLIFMSANHYIKEIVVHVAARYILC